MLQAAVKQRATKRPLDTKTRDNIAGYLFLAPALIGFLVFVIVPIVVSLGLSFTQWDFLTGIENIKFNGVENYLRLLSGQDEWFTKSLVNTVLFAAVTVPAGIVLGLVTATLINKYVYSPGLFKVLMFIPYISSVVASAVVWQVVFQPSYGPVNTALAALGMQDVPRWFVDNNWAFPLVMIFSIWQSLGYNTIVFSSGLKSIPTELYEAATIDGANELQKFRYITIPMISPTTFFLSTMSIIGSFKVFDAIKILTNGGPGNATTVIAFYIYREAFTSYRMGTANAAAWIMFALIFAVTMVQMRGQKKWVTYD